jgi:hypothetical protein
LREAYAGSVTLEHALSAQRARRDRDFARALARDVTRPLRAQLVAWDAGSAAALRTPPPLIPAPGGLTRVEAVAVHALVTAAGATARVVYDALITRDAVRAVLAPLSDADSTCAAHGSLADGSSGEMPPQGMPTARLRRACLRRPRPRATHPMRQGSPRLQPP